MEKENTSNLDLISTLTLWVCLNEPETSISSFERVLELICLCKTMSCPEGFEPLYLLFCFVDCQKLTSMLTVLQSILERKEANLWWDRLFRKEFQIEFLMIFFNILTQSWKKLYILMRKIRTRWVNYCMHDHNNVIQATAKHAFVFIGKTNSFYSLPKQ